MSHANTHLPPLPMRLRAKPKHFLGCDTEAKLYLNFLSVKLFSSGPSHGQPPTRFSNG